eukprot:CAMPEP_0175510328 /NCGR_PEP_ID=MMETSP0096-20121207/11335_1 /TAXON_ID=311494 /ORGANISM="Alexandrium monilatum, Strain CCMP3105" /LENGTH=168 /DNA_ID=CAMNT_0016812507 /DNA_START=133 /DNA_END=635 /DNA_ORIENTATION=-
MTDSAGKSGSQAGDRAGGAMAGGVVGDGVDGAAVDACESATSVQGDGGRAHLLRLFEALGQQSPSSLSSMDRRLCKAVRGTPQFPSSASGPSGPSLALPGVLRPGTGDAVRVAGKGESAAASTGQQAPSNPCASISVAASAEMHHGIATLKVGLVKCAACAQGARGDG